MAVRHQLIGQFSTTLSSGVNSSDTTWHVVNGSTLPATGLFFLACQGEIVCVTARANNALTVVRAESDTTASSHASGVAVTSLIVKDDLERLVNDVAEYRGEYGMPYGVLTAGGVQLDASDFTLINGGNAVEDELDGVVSVRVKNHTSPEHVTGASYFLGGGNWTVTAHLAAPAYQNRNSFATEERDYFGLYARDTSGAMRGITIGRIETGGSAVQFYREVQVHTRTSATATPTVNASADTPTRRDCFFRIVRASSTFTFWYSLDGVNFFQLDSQTWSPGDTSCGFYLNSNRTSNTKLQCLSWIQT